MAQRGSLSSVFRGALGLGTEHSAASAPPSKSSAQVSKQQAALNTMRAQSEALEKRAAHLDKQADAIREKAKAQLKAGDKKGAALMLKKETMYRKQAENSRAQQLNLDQQLMSLESIAGNAETVAALRTAKATQEHLLKGVKSDDVDELMADLQGMNDEADEVGRALGQEDPNDALEQEQIDNELAQMEAEELGTGAEKHEAAPPPVKTKVRLPPAPSHPVQLPTAPSHAPRIKVAVKVAEE